jgi:uncharacterized protein (UPF0332 family)
MKPETKQLFEGSDRELEKARKMLSVDEAESGTRDAYHAALFAARAPIFELPSLAPKTHSGTLSLFAELAIKPGLVDLTHSKTLTEGLHIRSDLDHEPLPKVPNRKPSNTRSRNRFRGANQERAWSP